MLGRFKENNMKILILDDARVIRNFHKNTLLSHNFEEKNFYEAEDGASALSLAKNEDINLFLVDWNIPKLNGLEFVKKIRTIDKYKKTPIIMITAEAAKYNVVEAIEAGVTNYIIKPIKEETLWEKISKYIAS
jgi:two-component system, chemotaxis family, chemotaxis protein CheY